METPEKIKALADLVEQIHEAAYLGIAALPDHQQATVNEQLFRVLQTINNRLVTYLAYTGDMLVGAELCNGCAEVDGTVVRIEREPELMIVTTSGGLYLRQVQCDRYFRLPGSDAYGELALVELARARADQAEKVPA